MSSKGSTRSGKGRCVIFTLPDGGLSYPLTWGASGQGGDSFMHPPAHLVGSVRLFGLSQRRSIFRRWLLGAKMASARRGSRMRSTGEAGVRGAHVLDARLALAETCRQE